MANELRLLFARTSTAALTYRLATSWGSDAAEPTPFLPFLSGNDFADLRWYLEDHLELPIGGGGAETRARRVETSLGAWGSRLFDADFADGDHRELYTALLDGPLPRLPLWITDAERAGRACHIVHLAILEAFQTAQRVGLRASLELSLKRLSPEARDAVRWLGLFRGGVSEGVLLEVSQLEAGAWEKIRGELEATALVGVERQVRLSGKPYLRFHPTLACAAGDGELGDEVRTTFVRVYWAVMRAVDKALAGSSPRGGMDVMAREEANFRTAVGWALAIGAYSEASGMADTLGTYLQRAGRLGERDTWVAWLAGEVRRGGFSEAVAEWETTEALALLRQGKAREAIEKLEGLVQRLEATTEFDARFALASAGRNLGCVYDAAGWSQKAIPVLQGAVGRWEALVDAARASGESAGPQRGNLAATLGDLANALEAAGNLDEARTVAERGAEMERELGHPRSIAVARARIAQILMLQGRYAEADARCDEALEAARRAGDEALEGAALQRRGSFAVEVGQLDRAAELYQHALHLFQEKHDDQGVMLTCNLLGGVEQEAGRLGEARAWYERSREIAAARKDQEALCQLEGGAARKQRDAPRARERFAQAARLVGESLAVWREAQREPNDALCEQKLAGSHLFGDLAPTEAHALRALMIRERRDLEEGWSAYAHLTDLAHTNGTVFAHEAATRERERATLRAELERRAGPPALPRLAIQTLAQLALDCAQAGHQGAPLPADAEEAITTIAAWPAALAALAPFLRALAAAETPPLPQGLPADLTAVLQQVLDAVHQTKRGV